MIMTTTSGKVPLDWISYQPVDEREYALYSLAYRHVYQFLVGVTVSVPMFYHFASQTVASWLAYTLSFSYVFLGLMLGQWVSGKVFVGHEVSFSKKQPVFKTTNLTGLSIVVLLGFIFISYFAVGTLGIWLR